MSKNSYYILGSVIAAWVVFGCTGYMTNSWSWRIPYIIQVPMALYILIAVQFVPETLVFYSPKVARKRHLHFWSNTMGMVTEKTLWCFSNLRR